MAARTIRTFRLDPDDDAAIQRVAADEFTDISTTIRSVLRDGLATRGRGRAFKLDQVDTAAIDSDGAQDSRAELLVTLLGEHLARVSAVDTGNARRLAASVAYEFAGFAGDRSTDAERLADALAMVERAVRSMRSTPERFDAWRDSLDNLISKYRRDMEQQLLAGRFAAETA